MGNPFDSPVRVRSRRTGSTGLSGWRRSHHMETQPGYSSRSGGVSGGVSGSVGGISGGVGGVGASGSATSTPTKASSMNMPTIASARRRARNTRTLLPPPRFHPPDPACSVTALLATSALPKSQTPESTDSTFRAHSALLRRVTLHRFDADRYLFVYKPLAKAHAVIAVQLLNVVPIAQRTGPLNVLLRSAAAYVAANARRSVYAMVLASELKCAFKHRPAAENVLPDVVLSADGLSEQQAAALDFVQELSSDASVVSEDTKRRVVDGSTESDGQLERVIAGVAAYIAFVSRLASVIDFELGYETVQFATTNLLGLPWKPSGGHFIIESLEAGTDDPFSLDSVGGSARQRLTKANRRSAKVGRGSSQRERRHNSNVRKVSQFLTASITAPRMTSDVLRATEVWMRSGLLPPPGQIFEMNDLITKFWGFQPFYLSTTVMASESMRRAFVLAAKELLFQEKEVSKRTKFIVCYVLAKGAEKARTAAKAERNERAERERELGKNDSLARARARSLLSVTSGAGTVTNAGSKVSLGVQPPVAEYDPLAIMTAHAAYLACKHGATPSELHAAADSTRVRAALDEASARRAEGAVGEEGENARDMAAAGLAHAMVARSGRVDAALLTAFEDAYGSPLKKQVRGGRLCHRALLEVLGAGALWAALERFAVAALAFDLDMTSNMMFGTARAEPAIAEFATSKVGRKCRLTLLTDEVGDAARIRRESKVGRMSSLMTGPRSPYRKRSTSALSTAPARVVRMLSSIGSNASHLSSS